MYKSEHNKAYISTITEQQEICWQSSNEGFRVSFRENSPKSRCHHDKSSIERQRPKKYW